MWVFHCVRFRDCGSNRFAGHAQCHELSIVYLPDVQLCADSFGGGQVTNFCRFADAAEGISFSS
jgi:hypothetical protein